MAVIWNERTTLVLQVSFFDENGSPVAPSAATYRIDTAGGTQILDTTNFPGPLASVVDLVITSGQNALSNQAVARETRHVTVEFDYGAPSKHGTAEYIYVLKNLFDNA